MAGTPAYVTQVAIYSKLKADTALMALITGVYDDPPDNTAFPYVTIGDAEEAPSNTFGKLTKMITHTINIWSRYQGYKEVFDIANRIITVLDHVALTIAGYTHIHTWYRGMTTARVPDGITRGANLRFQVWVEET